MSRSESNLLLLDLISALIEIQLKKVTLRGQELGAIRKQEKIQRFDLFLFAEAVAESGKFINVEMQASHMHGDSIENGFPNLKSRAIYYLTDIHSRQEGQGLAYEDFCQSFQITFCNFTLFPQYPDFVNSFCICHRKTGEALGEHINMITIEFPKLLGNVMQKNVKDMTSLEKWSIFLGFADNQKFRKLIEAIIDDKEEIDKAMDILSNISTNEDERARYFLHKKLLQDMEHDYQMAKKEGRQEGRQEGLQEGLQEGRQEGLEEGIQKVAKNLLNGGLSVEQIMQYTGLTLSEIEKLKIS
jgi:predicted transposase/invertase (TIGR01784 family)